MSTTHRGSTGTDRSLHLPERWCVGMGEAEQRQLIAMFDALAQVAKSGRPIAVGDGGTGRHHASGGRRAPRQRQCVPAPRRRAGQRDSAARQDSIDPHHSHIVAVDNPAVAAAQDAWGSETGTMYWLLDRLAAGRPSVTVVANGGGITLSEVDANVRAGRPMILIEGSGRAADALVSLIRKTAAPAGEITELRARVEAAKLTRRPELFTVVPLQTGAPGLRQALIQALDRRP